MEDCTEFLIPKLEFTLQDRDAILSLSGEEGLEELSALLEVMNSLARPKILYGVYPVSEKRDGGVTINGVRINCALMKNNFENIGRVFPYIITSGSEMAEQAAGLDDPLAQFWADEIMKRWLFKAIIYYNTHIKECYGIKNKLAAMNPGSIKEWPLSGQSQLFAILGGTQEVESRTGVRLTRSMLMLPSKSVSGISFATNSEYENCSLCPIITCPNRRAEYKPELY